MLYTVNLSQDKSSLNPYITTTLLKKIEENLKLGKKIILYLNRRGDFSSLVCRDCQHIYRCPQCDTSLSVHKYPEKLLCHFCSFQREVPLKCDMCKGSHLAKVGVGTQQIEKSISTAFASAEVYRFDYDSIKNLSQKKLALEHLTKAQIIIGTKMITTGFDFKNIGLIGVILAEQELLIPNYDAEERLYLNLKQLIGRTREKDTDIVIQSFVTENEAIKNITQKNYKEFFLESLEERKKFDLPPYTQMAELEYRSKNKQQAVLFMTGLKNKLDILSKDQNFTISLSGNVRKKYNQFYVNIQVKGAQVREFLAEIKLEILRNPHLTIAFI